MPKSKKILFVLIVGFVFLILACDDKPSVTKKTQSHEVSGKISQPIVQNKPQKVNKIENEKAKLNPKIDQASTGKPEVRVKDAKESVDKVSEQKSDVQKPDIEKKAHYDSAGKIDPFKPLIQDKAEEAKPVVDKGPKRILTPLEKIELSQIRLVAVIIMQDKRIAMVEEASGKGYEVGIGTYIGKNSGKVFQIKDSSILIKELVKDFKGRLKEQVQEIKLHKNDGEG